MLFPIGLASFSFFPNNTPPPLPGVNGSKAATIRSKKNPFSV
jgi:hypothetical protein